MSRRDTIIISVLVNAALLVVLFTFAVTSKENKNEETIIASSNPAKEISIDAKEMLFSDANSKQDFKNLESEVLKEFVSLENKSNEPIEKPLEVHENVAYKLPQIVKAPEEKKSNSVDQNAFEITIKSGDSLEKLAHLYNTKVSEISELNNLTSSFLKIGQKLLIPKTSTNVNLASQMKKEEQKLVAAEYYTIKVGDNPYTIAIKHSIKPHELLKLNNLDEKKAKRLKPGDKLRIR